MVCTKCGTPIADNIQNCPNCGAATGVLNSAPVNPAPVMQSAPAQQPVNPVPVAPIAQTTTGLTGNNKKGGNGLLIVIIVLLLGIIIAGVVYFVIMGKSLGGDSNNNTTTKSEVNNNTNAVPKNTGSSNNYTVSFGGFNFSIPSDITTEFKEDYLYLYTEDFLSSASIIQGAYNNLILAQDKMKSNIEANGIKVSKYGERTYSGKKALVFDVEAEGEEGSFVYGALDSNNIYYFFIQSYDASENDTYIGELVNVFANGKLDSATQSIKSDSKFKTIDGKTLMN